MEFKYYDVLSSLVVGYVVLIIGMYSFHIDYNSDYTVAYLAIAFLCGYIINSIGSLLEPIYYFTIGGKPSNRLLDDGKKKHCWFHNLFVPKNTGIKKARFYETATARKLLLEGFEDEDPKEDRLFSKAMRTVNGDQNTRVRLSRTLCTIENNTDNGFNLIGIDYICKPR